MLGPGSKLDAKHQLRPIPWVVATPRDLDTRSSARRRRGRMGSSKERLAGATGQVEQGRLGQWWPGSQVHPPPCLP